jgi:SAM-dependent methyltransferase
VIQRRRSRASAPLDDADSLTSTWFDGRALDQIHARYRTYPLVDVSYATVRDFVESFEHLNPLACAQGDLKDVQRPWTLKSILSSVPRGGRVLEIGGGQPYVADLLARMGYEVWLVDPYDGSGNGPVEYEFYKAACPRVRFVRSVFNQSLRNVPEKAFDCIFSISVLEHIHLDGLTGAFSGLDRFLSENGVSVHAVDHVHKGRGDVAHLEKLRFIVASLGLSLPKLEQQLAALGDDTETYYLSAESHNRWRGSLPYDEFPMRICVSVHLISSAAQFAGARS